MAGAWQLLEAVPRHGTSHAALVTDILEPHSHLPGTDRIGVLTRRESP
jgi:hypothetical protein